MNIISKKKLFEIKQGCINHSENLYYLVNWSYYLEFWLSKRYTFRGCFSSYIVVNFKHNS